MPAAFKKGIILARTVKQQPQGWKRQDQGDAQCQPVSANRVRQTEQPIAPVGNQARHEQHNIGDEIRKLQVERHEVPIRRIPQAHEEAGYPQK